jgi:hypothetical protein
MVDVLLSNENVSIFGGPASLDVNVDYGAQGVRGSLIFSGPGKPTDAIVQFPTPPRPQDLYINLLPSDFEYLFLYQYGSVNGVLQWSKVLRLIPNTAIANIPVIFIDGIARTLVPTADGLAYISSIPPTVPPTPVADSINSIIEGIVANNLIGDTAPSPAIDGMLWIDTSITLTPPKTLPELKVYNAAFSVWVTLATIQDGLFFPISDYFSAEEILVGESSGFNIQYVLINENPTSSGLSVGELTENLGEVFLPVSLHAAETIPFTPGSLLTWRKINGVRTLSFVVVANIGTLPLFDISNIS